MDLTEFEVSLVYEKSSRTVRAGIQRNPVLKNKQTNKRHEAQASEELMTASWLLTWYIEEMSVQRLAPVHIDQLSSDEGSCRGQQEAHYRGDLGTEEDMCLHKRKCWKY